MPKYRVTVPNGRAYKVDAPDENTAYLWALQTQEQEDALKKQRPGLAESFKQGLADATVGAAKAGQQTFQPGNLELEKQLLGDGKPSWTWEDVEKAANRGQYGEALSEAWGFGKQTLGGSVGALLPAALGGLAAARYAPTPYTKLAGTAAAGGLLALEHYGSDVRRQAAEREAARQAGSTVPAWQFGKAGAAAAGQSALDLITLRVAGLQRLFGMGEREAAKKAANELASEGWKKSLGVGTLRTAAAEVPTEISQQALERWQAGLPLTNADAYKEYKESAAGAAFLSPAFGLPGRRMEVGAARREEARKAEEEQRVMRAQADRQRASDSMLAGGPTRTLPGMEDTPDQLAARIDDITNSVMEEAAARKMEPEQVMLDRQNKSKARIASLARERDKLIAQGKVDEAEIYQQEIINETKNLRGYGGFTMEDETQINQKLAKARKKLEDAKVAFTKATTAQEIKAATDMMDKMKVKINDIEGRVRRAAPNKPSEAQMGFDFDAPAPVAKPVSVVSAAEDARVSGAPEFKLEPAPSGRPGVGAVVEMASPNIVTKEVLRSWGLPLGSPKVRSLIGLNLDDPAHVDRIRAELGAYAERTNAPGVATTIENMPLVRGQEQREIPIEPILAQQMIEEQQQADFNAKRAADRAEKLKLPSQRAEEERTRADKEAARWTEADQEKLAQENQAFEAQRRQTFEEQPYGTQGEFGFGAAPAQPAAEAQPSLDDLVVQYRQARDAKDAEALSTVEDYAKQLYPGQWAQAKYNALSRPQSKLDFGGKRETEPMRADTDTGSLGGAERPAGEPSVGVAGEPEAGPAAEGTTPSATGGLGFVERPAGRRDAGKEAHARALVAEEETQDAVQEPSAAEVSAPERTRDGKEMGAEVSRDQAPAQETEVEAIDPVKIISRLNEISTKEKNSATGKAARAYRAGKTEDDLRAADAFVKDYEARQAPEEKPAPVKAEKPAPVKAEKPAPVKAEKPAPVKAEKPAPVKAAPKTDTAAAIKTLEAKRDAELAKSEDPWADETPNQTLIAALENQIAKLQRGAAVEPETTVQEGNDVEATVDAALTADERQLVANDPQLGNGDYATGREKLIEYVADSFMGKSIAHLKKAIRDLITKLKHGALSVMVAFNFNPNIPVSTVNIQGAEFSASAYARTVDVGDAPVPNSVLGVANHALNRGNGLPFTVIDKPNAKLYAFLKDGRMVGSSSVLIGATKRDALTPSWGTQTLDEMKETDKVTPAGVFTGRFSLSSEYGSTISLEETESPSTFVAIHRTYLGTPSENRLARYATPTPEDNRVSYGCINVPSSFYDNVLTLNFKGKSQIYVMPDNSDARAFFNIQDTRTVSTGGKTETATEPARGDVVGKEETVDEDAPLSRKIARKETDKKPRYTSALELGTDLVKEFGVGAIKAAVDAGRLKVYDSETDPRMSERDRAAIEWAKKNGGGDPSGFYQPKGDYVVLIANNTARTDGVKAAVHEAGVHAGWKAILGDAAYARVMKQLDDAVKSTEVSKFNTAAKEADAAAQERAALPEHIPEERLAYLSERYSDLPLVKRVLAQLRNWARAHGLNIDFTADDLAVMARDIADKWMTQGGRKTDGAPMLRTEGAAPDVDTTAPIGSQRLQRMGRSLPSDDRRTLSDQIRDINAVHADPKAAASKLYDKLMTKLDKAYAFEEGIRGALKRAFGDGAKYAEEVTKLGIIAQIGHIPAVADVAMERGGYRYNPDAFVFEATDSDANFKRLYDMVLRMAKTHNISNDEASAYASAALEARRQSGINKVRAEKLALAGSLEATGKRANIKKAKEIRDKWEEMRSHMTEADIAEGLKLFGDYPEIAEIEALKNDIRAWVVDALVRSGFWTRDQATSMLDNADWVPFNREFNEDETFSMEQYHTYVQGLQTDFKQKRYIGSERGVKNVIDNFERWTHTALTRGMRNQATAALLKDAVKYGLAETSGKPGRFDANTTAHYYENGKVNYVRFDDPLQAALFTSGFATPPVSKLLQHFNTLFRNSIVATPTFSAAQLIKDPWDAIKRSGLPPEYALRIEKYALEEMAAMLRGETTATRELLTKRGLVGAATDLAAVRREELKNAIGYKAGQSEAHSKLGKIHERAVNAGLRGSMYSDNAVRQAVYRAAIDAGETDASATKLAADVINFRRQLGDSDALKMMAAYVPFAGAAMAATRASLMAIAGKGGARSDMEGRLRYAKLVATTTAISTLFAMLAGDDDEYKAMSIEQRARQITIPGFGGFGIPRRVSIESLPEIMAEITLNQMSDNAKDSRTVRRAVAGILHESLVPVPAPMPAPIKTAVEEMTDYNFFTGAPVVGARLKQQEAFLQYGEGTSEFAKMMGSLADAAGLPNAISPKRVDHVIHGMLGVTGSMALLLSNIALGSRESMSVKDMAASIPGLTMPGAKEFNNATRNELYDWMDKINEVVETANRLKREGRVEDYQAYMQEHQKELQYKTSVNQIELQLSKIRQRMGVVRASNTMSGDEKKSEIDRLKTIELRYINNLNVAEKRKTVFE
jgi:hypothetical protein